MCWTGVCRVGRGGHLTPHALLASPAKGADVLPHAFPHKSSRDEPYTGPNPRMGQAVLGFKILLA
jgi:hypothetical protein